MDRTGVHGALATLEQEIGVRTWGSRHPRAVMREWIRQLARTVKDVTIPSTDRYGEQIVRWATEIETCPEEQFVKTCQCVDDAIDRIDNDDGWPSTEGNNTLKHLCVAALMALDDRRRSGTRWPAHASETVWRHATGCTGTNEVVRASLRAWQREVYTRALAIVDHRNATGTAAIEEVYLARTSPEVDEEEMSHSAVKWVMPPPWRVMQPGDPGLRDEAGNQVEAGPEAARVRESQDLHAREAYGHDYPKEDQEGGERDPECPRCSGSTTLCPLGSPNWRLCPNAIHGER